MPVSTPSITSLTAAGTNYGAATLSWTHSGTTNPKFEVLYKRPYDIAYKTLHLAAESAFGSGGSYSMEVPLTDSVVFAVRAINPSTGEASAKATHTSVLTVDGFWLLPFENNQITDTEWAWIGGTLSLEAERDGTLHRIPTRPAKVNVTTGTVHLYEGTLSGLLLGSTHNGANGDAWLGALERLVRDQKTYRWVWLASARWLFKCEITTGVQVTATPANGRGYEVSVGVRELSSKYGV